MMRTADDKLIRQTFNNLVQAPSDSQIKTFAGVVETLTGNTFDHAIVTTTDDVSDIVL
ncbi:hypothetical protein [Secundilactobacillus paracollinoides]|uniref:DUF1659 domain-containing protein n=1 Tax=Secundilactobacillus paracollinoides TaxID=240427 RepID=UPI0006EEE3D6|nr:hypothetical protein [Secundilactobacillus paracollinoides]KRL76747.1 hypothetical protein FC17_GL001642 [Secundilactobacillus paracollinoides DSM 15502 = JCM 11969]